MNLDGSKQREGIDYDQTLHAPVATWESIRLLLGMVPRTNGRLSNSTTFWRSRKLQTQRMLHEDATRIKQLMNLENGPASEKNIYGQKQGGRVWNLD
jgi:hypothetical protein